MQQVNKRVIMICFLLFLVFSGVGMELVQAAPKIPVKVKSVKINITEKKITIRKGEKIKLHTKVSPAKATKKKLKWKSSKKSVVSVNKKGVIRGKKNGIATITAKTTDGSGKKTSIKVIVGTKVSSVNINRAKSDSELVVGDTMELNAKVSPQNASIKKLKWYSSDSSIASVDSSGEVQGKGNGRATITAKATDGTGKKYSVPVNVVTYVKNFSFSFNTTAYVSKVNGTSAVVKKGKSFVIKTTVSPETASNPAFTWTSSNPEVATIDSDGTVRTYQAGVVELTAKAKDKKEHSDKFRVYVNKLGMADAKYIGHRGFSEIAPDNSYSAIKLALDTNFNGVEIDIHKTSDNEFVVSHDESLQSACNVDLDISSLTLAQVTGTKITNGSGISKYTNEYIPSLESILTLMESYKNTGKTLFVEIKDTFTKADIQKLLKTIEQHGLYDCVRIISFEKNNLKLVREVEADQVKKQAPPTTQEPATTQAPPTTQESATTQASPSEDSQSLATVSENESKENVDQESTDSAQLEKPTESGEPKDNSGSEKPKDNKPVEPKKQIALMYLATDYTSDCLDICRKYKADIGVKYSGISENNVETLHEEGILVDVWTIPNFMTAVTMVQSLGVDMITTNYSFAS